MGIFFSNNKKEKQAKLIEEARKDGYNAALSEVKTNPKLIADFGDSTSIEISSRKYSATISHMDMMQNIGWVTIKGLPYHSYEIVEHTYFNGMTAFVKNKLGIIEYGKVVAKEWNGNGRITKFNILQNRPNPLLDFGKVYCNHIDGVILYDTLPGGLPRAALIGPIIENIQQIFAKLGVNIVLSGDKIVFQGIDVESQDNLEKGAINAFKSSKATIAVDSLFQNKPPEILSIDGRFMELWGALKQYDIFRQSIHGFGTGGYGADKKAHNLVLEVEVQEGSVNNILCARKTMWQEWVDEMLIIFKKDIKVVFAQ